MMSSKSYLSSDRYSLFVRTVVPLSFSCDD